VKPDVYTRIEAFNAGRDPERLALKYAAMAGDAFAFLRGTCHLFYADLPVDELPKAPLVWCCGDLHLENFGTFKGDNRLTYFDLNDFDEACVAPASWDLARCLTSALVAGETLKLKLGQRQAGAAAFLDGYGAALAGGKARWLERATAEGLIAALLSRIKERTRRDFLDRRTELVKRRRHLLTGNDQALPIDERERKKLTKFVKNLAAQSDQLAFYGLLDAARRIAGTGSLGLERYVLLVEGRGSPDNNFLLDLKFARGSAVVAALHPKQPRWGAEAERVVFAQQAMQAMSPALMRAVGWKDGSFVLQELMPTADRLKVTKWRDDPAAFLGAIRTMGEVTAWAQLRAHSQRGSAAVEELVDYGGRRDWRKPLLQVAAESAERTQAQWREFAKAWPKPKPQ